MIVEGDNLTGSGVSTEGSGTCVDISAGEIRTGEFCAGETAIEAMSLRIGEPGGTAFGETMSADTGAWAALEAKEDNLVGKPNSLEPCATDDAGLLPDSVVA